MSKFHKAIFLSITVCIFSCRKDVPISTPQTITTSSNNIITGETVGMNFKTYDTLIGTNHGSSLDIDFNLDGKKDFSIYGNWYAGPGHSQLSVSGIQIYNSDFYLATSIFNDTTFSHFNGISIDSFVNPRSIQIKYNYSYLCDRINVSDSVVNYSSVKHTRYFNAGENIIVSSNSWSNTSLNLTDPFVDIPTVYNIYSSADTLISKIIWYYPGCHDLIDNKIIYIGFKLKSGTDFKLGWIKLMQTTRPTLLLSAIAIQK